MPTYEYECTKCGIVFEEFQSISAPKRQRCPRCRGKVERLISGGTGVVFRGNGFYVTDSRPSPAPTGAKKDDAKKDDKVAAAKGSDSTAATADSKPSRAASGS